VVFDDGPLCARVGYGGWGLDETLTAQPGHLWLACWHPEAHGSPGRVITRRLVITLTLLFAATVVVYLDRNGYRDVAWRLADIPGLPLLRGGVAIDDRLRRHHPYTSPRVWSTP